LTVEGEKFIIKQFKLIGTAKRKIKTDEHDLLDAALRALAMCVI
jgi:hypothetical protein